MQTKRLGRLGLGAFVGAVVLAATSAPAAGQSQAVFDNLALSPDGNRLAYLERRTGAQAALHVREVTSAADVVLASMPDEPDAREIRAVWSPDGSKIAWFWPEAEGWVLRVRDVARGTERRYGDLACARAGRPCARREPVWSRDGATLYFLTGGKATPWFIPRPETPLQADAVTVQSHTPEAAASGRVAYDLPSDLVALRLASGRVDTLFTGASLFDVWRMKDDDALLVSRYESYERQVRQTYGALYRIADRPAPRACRGPANPSCVQPLIGKIEFSYWGLGLSFSQDGRTIGYASTGDLAPSEVRFVDVMRGAQTAFTPKFDGAVVAPNRTGAWSSDGRSVLMPRIDEKGRATLWRISRQGEAKPVDIGAASAVRFCERSEGAATTLVVTRDIGGTSLLRDDGAAVRTLAEVPGAVTSCIAVKDGVYASTGSWDEPRELRFYNDAGVRNLTSANADIDRSTIPSRERVAWRDRRGVMRNGWLYRSRGSSRTVAAPVILQIYPHRPQEWPELSNRFGGDERALLRPLRDLLDDGYAVYEPEVTPEGGETSCEGVAADASLALAALAGRRDVDLARVGAIGHSFGGWGVLCIATGAPDIKATIAVSGIANYLSLSFSPVGQASTYALSGGQAEIGQPLDKAPLAYWRSSPVSRIKDAHAPILLVGGSEDRQTPYDQMEEMFVGLKMANKRVELVRYEGGSHSSVLQHPDYGPRVKAWFDRYVKGQ